MIDRYGMLAAVVAEAADCVGNASDCTYQTFVGLGSPPSDCSLISASWVGDSMRRADRCRNVVDSNFELRIVRCCLTNTGEEFDAMKEDADAACFLADYEAMLNCLLCSVKDIVNQHGFGCDEQPITGSMLDENVMGNCYGAVFQMTLRHTVTCCP